MTVQRRLLNLLGLFTGLAAFAALFAAGFEAEVEVAVATAIGELGSRAEAERNVGVGAGWMGMILLPVLVLHVMLAVFAWFRQPRLRALGFPAVEACLGLWAAFVWPIWSSLPAYFAFPILTMLVYFLTARRWPSGESSDRVAALASQSEGSAASGKASPAAGA